MSKKSSSARRTKLKARHARLIALGNGELGRAASVTEWAAAYDAAPAVAVELLTDEGVRIASIESAPGEDFSLLILDEPVAGSHEAVHLLAPLLLAALDDIAVGGKCRLAFNQWFIDELESLCEAGDTDVVSLLRTFLPKERRGELLPSMCLL